MKSAAKIIFSFGIIFLLLKNVDTESIYSIFVHSDKTMISIALGFYLLASIFEVIRLHSLVPKLLSFFSTIKIVYISLLFNNLLPLSIGGYAYKVYILKKIVDTKTSIAIVIFEKVFGIATITLCFIIYLFLKPVFLTTIQESISAHVNTKRAMIFSVLFFTTFLISIGLLSNIKHRRFLNRLLKSTHEVLLVFKSYCKLHFLRQFVLAFAYHSCRLFAIFYLVKSFSANTDWINIIPVISLLAFTSLIPLTIGGLGLREGTFVGGLMLIGIDYDVAMSVAAVNLCVIYFKSCIGMIIFLLSKKGKILQTSTFE